MHFVLFKLGFDSGLMSDEVLGKASLGFEIVNDLEILTDKAEAHLGGNGDVELRQAIENAGENAFEGEVITNHGFRGMASLATDLREGFFLDEELGNDQSLVSQRRAHVVNGAATRNGLAGFRLVGADMPGHGGRRGLGEDGDVGQGQDAALPEGFVAEADEGLVASLAELFFPPRRSTPSLG